MLKTQRALLAKWRAPRGPRSHGQIFDPAGPIFFAWPETRTRFRHDHHATLDAEGRFMLAALVAQEFLVLLFAAPPPLNPKRGDGCPPTGKPLPDDVPKETNKCQRSPFPCLQINVCRSPPTESSTANFPTQRPQRGPFRPFRPVRPLASPAPRRGLGTSRSPASAAPGPPAANPRAAGALPPTGVFGGSSGGVCLLKGKPGVSRGHGLLKENLMVV